MKTITIEASKREPGKSNTRAVRREDDVPCVLYGGKDESVPFRMPRTSLTPLISSSEANRIEIKVDGKKWNCILKDVDFHPITDRPMHADFQVLVKGTKITLMIPVQYHGIPLGQVEDGGDTQVVAHELEARCLPDNIPSHIDVDIEQLRIGDSVHVGDLTVEGVEFSAAPERTIVTVVAPKIFEEPELEAEEELPEDLAEDVEEAEEAAEESEEGEVTE